MSGAAGTVVAPTRTRTLHALVARILPGVDGPGADDAGVAAAFERLVQHRSLRAIRRGIDQVLDRLEAHAHGQYGRAFADCAPGKQDGLLEALERDPDPWTRFLFRFAVTLSIQGLLGDPVHGGNRGFVGWRAIGRDPADVRSGLCRGGRGA